MQIVSCHCGADLKTPYCTVKQVQHTAWWEMELLGAASLSFILSCFVITARGQDCDYRFTQEPVRNLSCNLSRNERLRISCTVVGPSFVTIKWIWQNSNNVIEVLQNSDIDVTISDPITGSGLTPKISSRLGVRNWTGRTGLYWCQVELGNGTALGESNRLMLLEESAYTHQSQCSDEDLLTEDNRCVLPLPVVILNTSTTPTSPAPTAPTTTMATNQTAPPTQDSLGPALYAVIAVILIFVLVIVTLTLVIVCLYRRKFASFRADFKTADQRGSNPYSGFTKERQRLNGATNNGTSQDPSSSLPSSAHSTRPHLLSTSTPTPQTTSSPQELTDGETYSRLLHSHLQQSGSVSMGYSKLEVGEDTPPPRPQKSVSPQTSLVASTSSQQRMSRIYGDLNEHDLDKVASGESPTQGVPRTSIYNTLEGPGHISSIRASHPDYDPVVLRRGSEKSNSKNSAIFDDPGYSPLKGEKKQFEVIDPRYVGDYERSPEYTCPTVKLTAEEIDPKYRGNYERDPNYIPKPPPRRASESGRNRTSPKEPVARQPSTEVDPLSKYRGDYERSPNYIPPPLRGVESPIATEDVGLLDRKYSGNYERDPLYMANLVNKAREERASSAEHSQSRNNSTSKNSSLVSPHSYFNVEQESGKFSDNVFATEYPDESASLQQSMVGIQDNNVVSRGYVNIEQESGKFSANDKSIPPPHRTIDSSVVSSHSYVNVEQGSGKFSLGMVSVPAENNEPMQQGTFMDI